MPRKSTVIQPVQHVFIQAPRFSTVAFCIVGTSPYVQHKFSVKAREQLRRDQEAGQASRKGKKREPKDFTKLFERAQYRSTEGWRGIPAAAIRNALISACRLVGFHMSKAKLSIFVEPDGFDAEDGTPLVRITKGEPIYHESYVRNESGVVDLRARPMWLPGWEAHVRIRFDADLFTVEDVADLLLRAGQQVGIGEGRPDSPRSCGMGWGLFTIKEQAGG